MDSIPNASTETSPGPERLLVVGGGGSRGAWSAAFAKYLTGIHHRPYRYVWGTSTGSLMAPMIVINDFCTLEKVYTSVTQEDIFDISPFKENGELKRSNAVGRLIARKKTFGESNNLRKLIDKHFTSTVYDTIWNGKTEVEFNVCTLNYKTGEVHNFPSGLESTSREEMIDKIWASSNQPIFMTFVEDKFPPDGAYVDGGVKATVPVIKALTYATEHNITEIDILINTPEDPIINKKFVPKKILKSLMRLIEFWKQQVQEDNIRIATLLAELQKCKTELKKVKADLEENLHPNPDGKPEEKETFVNLNFYFFPSSLFEDNFKDLVFDPEKMKALWKAGECGECDRRIPPVRISFETVKQFASMGIL